MPNRIAAVEECDATDDDSSTADDNKKNSMQYKVCSI